MVESLENQHIFSQFQIKQNIGDPNERIIRLIFSKSLGQLQTVKNF